MPFADVNGQRLYYEDTGGDGPVIVFSHGLFMNADMFAPQVAALRDRYRCISWDERGHGRTGEATEPFTYWDSADDLDALLDFLGVGSAVLAGMSQGGYLSLRCALAHPERVAGLVLLDTQARDDDAATHDAYDQLIDAWAEHGVDAIAESVGGIILDHRFALTADWIEKWRDITPANLRLIYQTLITRESLVGRLPEITVPAVVVWGESDLAISEEAARELDDGLVDSELVRVPDAGHAANLTHPEQVTPATEKLLQRVYG